MKEAYVYRDKKIIAADLIEDKGTEVHYDYQDNIEKIMKTENILEYLNSHKKEILKNIKDLEKNIESANEYKIQTIIASIFVIILCTNMLTIFKFFAYIPTLVLILFCSGIVIFRKNNNTLLRKKLNGNKLELDKIEEQIKKNEEYLETLIKDKKCNVANIEQIKNKVNFVRYKEKLNELKTYLETYRLIGKNIELYKKFYKKGILEEKLENKYEESQIRLIKKYLEEEKST